MMLADERGRWSTSGAMFIRRCRFHVATNYRFLHPGHYEFSIRQGMRTDTLKGIRYVSFILREH
jgi:gliding motility-associated lipoprotein GldH